MQVRSFFDQAHGELEQMLHDTSRLLGDLTSYAGVVVGPTPSEATVRSVQVVGITPTDGAGRRWCCRTARSRSTRSSWPSRSARSASRRPRPTSSAHLDRDTRAQRLGVAARTGDAVTDAVCAQAAASLRP